MLTNCQILKQGSNTSKRMAIIPRVKVKYFVASTKCAYQISGFKFLYKYPIVVVDAKAVNPEAERHLPQKNNG